MSQFKSQTKDLAFLPLVVLLLLTACTSPTSQSPSTQTAAPGVPAGVTVSAGNSQVTISWTAVTGAASYNLYWSKTAGVTTTNGTKIANVTSPYVHAGLINGTSYDYIVTAVNAGGESAASSQATARPQVSAPGAPTGVTVSISNATVTLSWTAVSGAASYNLYWSTTTGVTAANGTKIANVTSPYTLTNLTNGTTYYYILTAVSAGGESAASTQAGATPVATVTTLAGGGSLGGTAPGHADGTGTTATFSSPAAVAVDSSGNLYIADGDYNLIRKITPSGVVTTLAGGGSVGGIASGNADGTGTAATFNGPAGVTVDSSGNLYVADNGNNLIRKISPSGVVTTLAGGGSGTAATFNGPVGVAGDSSGNLYVADNGNNLIRKISPSGVVTTLAGGGGVGGTAYGHADGTGTSATFTNPQGIAVDASGNLYVADTGNNLIRKITSSGVVTTLVGGGSAGGTTRGHTDGTGTSATFFAPTGVAVDSSGNLYVTDVANHLIRKITSSGVVTTVAGGGSVGGTDEGNADGTGTAATFTGPMGVAVDASGNLYVADSSNNLIRKIH